MHHGMRNDLTGDQDSFVRHVHDGIPVRHCGAEIPDLHWLVPKIHAHSAVPSDIRRLITEILQFVPNPAFRRGH